jgi:hypothetical protein
MWTAEGRSRYLATNGVVEHFTNAEMEGQSIA